MTDRNKKYYTQFASDLFDMCGCFEEAGFTKEQSFELVSTYVRQSCLEDYLKQLRNMEAKTQKLRSPNRTSQNYEACFMWDRRGGYE